MDLQRLAYRINKGEWCARRSDADGESTKMNTLEEAMPEYEICYRDQCGNLIYQFSASCVDDKRAAVLAHAMKLPDSERLEVWNGESLVYRRPQKISGPIAEPGS
jgi:hypothetical protein